MQERLLECERGIGTEQRRRCRLVRDRRCAFTMQWRKEAVQRARKSEVYPISVSPDEALLLAYGSVNQS